MAQNYEKAVLAGGCFWCIEHDLEPLEGVIETHVGYAGGHVENPTYEQVTSGNTGHVEAVEVTYDPALLSYEDLLRSFWQKVDPFDAGGQFCDRGNQYRAVIFTKTPEEKTTAENLKKELGDSLGQSFVTDIIDYKNFYPAEDYHQKYAKKNPTRYGFYRWNCGRDRRVKEVWGHAPSN